ncbi:MULTISPECIES: hydroxyisourate hydrolase [Ramlibacter]|uniref:5-hydroxyisourate hydrolase n=1 Tax=Ramlibacter aquaticus TaxID=2780094 RepID=A0ABR9SIN4_9BURK|nr:MULTISPECIES: hydroxyisourate hydrolase [Ramlibacter]MBE7942125.1 hydroxyisourate hydrolase [Ramlibacter aquaticus]
MGLSTHVLDTMNGCPAAGMTVDFYDTADGGARLLRSFQLNADGRTEGGPVLDTQALRRGTYRLVFHVAAYFRARGVELPDPPFLDRVALDFGIADTASHYHVPLLASPWSCSTYRGS